LALYILPIIPLTVLNVFVRKFIKIKDKNLVRGYSKKNEIEFGVHFIEHS